MVNRSFISSSKFIVVLWWIVVCDAVIVDDDDDDAVVVVVVVAVVADGCWVEDVVAVDLASLNDLFDRIEETSLFFDTLLSCW